MTLRWCCQRRPPARSSFARALREFSATITFAGSLQGTTRTLPLEIYLQREVDADSAIALSLLLVVVAALVIGLARRSGDGGMSLSMHAVLADRDLDVSLNVPTGQTLGLLGPTARARAARAGRACRTGPTGRRAVCARR